MQQCLRTLECICVVFDQQSFGKPVLDDDIESKTNGSSCLEFPSFAGFRTLKCLSLWYLPLDTLLSSAPTLPQLLSPSVVAIQFRFDLDPIELTQSHEAGWQEIDRAINDTKFKDLSYFVIWTDPFPGGHVDRQVLETAFMRTMPDSYKRGIIWWGDDETSTGENMPH
ncbi:hypothetical protein NLI96_g9960 [Meripilus lineatus]|uniref:Uncharacterized protein n=1 Tax=Meripilus lineatus TaxID=2056292 RepID=A0AAD5UUT3_9APHY|nr:hypothetical protein NLI96_g9960 [Physisporinus lineatus]